MEGKSINYEERYKIEKKLDKKGIKNYKAYIKDLFEIKILSFTFYFAIWIFTFTFFLEIIFTFLLFT